MTPPTGSRTSPNHPPTAAEALAARRRYVTAWNDTMLRIWRERITLLGVIHTGALLRSPLALPLRADGRFIEFTLQESFLQYGLWQDYGTGRETPREGSGDLGRAKVRRRRKWFSTKYYASVMNLRDFLADNAAEEFVGLLCDSFDRRAFRLKL